MTDATVVFGSFRLNSGRRELTREGKRVALGGRALEILCLLAAADGEPVSKSALLARLWPGAVAGENNLHVHISALRQQLGESGRTHLVTVPAYGYRLLASAIPPTRRVSTPPEGPTLGVLAFRNISGETRYDAFTEGLTDGVVTQLARTRSLVVVAGTDAANGEIDSRRIGRQLGVHYILQGTTRCDAESVRVNARLIDARTGAHLWAQSYRRALDEPYRAQDELANALAAAMDVVVTGLEQRIALRKRTGDLGAWETYERGLWHFALCGIDENERARDLLQRSIILNPELSKAYQWLVYVYVQDGIHYRTRPIEEAHGVAEELAMKAIVLDPDDAGTYAALGFVAQMGNDLPRALANAERALTLNPNDGDALRLKGACQLGLGLGAEGAETLRMSVQLRPSDPLNWRAPHHLCWYSYLAGDYAAGAETGRAALRANASQCLTHAWLAASLAQVGKTAEAQDVIARAAKLVAPLSFSDHVRRRLPWVQEEGHARMLDGLRKAGWHG